MKLNCSKCQADIKPEDINITTDLAKCHECGAIHKVSSLSGAISLGKKEVSMTPPTGSRIIMRRGDFGDMEFIYPKKGFKASMLPLVFFTTFWLGFITFWTWGASQGSIIFALFSIPFWVVGIGLVLALANAISEIQILTFSKHTLTIEKQRLIKPQKIEISIMDIEAIKMYNKVVSPLVMLDYLDNPGMGSNQKTILKWPAVISGIKTEYFFNRAKPIEQEWIADILSDLVNKIKG